mmetsp:Transcript_4238/g.4202  ORF Transcript_4238/g.4202 Transcript_4238/m.4202 type:complete len:131 (-) Transcript_4238:56-448(-)
MFDTEGYGDGYKYAYPNFKRDVARVKSLDVEVQASGYARKRTGNREDKDLEAAVQGMRINVEDEEEEEDDRSEIDSDYEQDEETEDSIEEYESEEELKDDEEENEQIIEALSSGVKKLKMDKLGNYILDE